MASKQISPAAQLLRHSKLFSIPKPLPKPPTGISEAVAQRYSETATDPYPTHAAIITTHKGRTRGDWGLKRNLPVRKTADRRNPIVQIRAVDNIDHYTDWEHGTPHAIALRKFQEMNVPIIKPEFSGMMMRALLSEGGKSVFDVYEPDTPRESTLQNSKDSNYTSTLEALQPKQQETPREVERWKYGGPWLAGLDEVQFDKYLTKQVTPKRAEFKKFLWSWMEKTKASRSKSQQMASGTMSTEQEATLTEEEYETWLVELRQEGQQLYALMWEFLDLPGRPPSEKDDQSVGPPRTHPSAGLSYLKTDSTLQNHPVLGPMLEHQPVLARVLQKPNTLSGKVNDKGDTLGVAGFVGNNKEQRSMWATAEYSSQGMYGEKKIHVVPNSAKIDEHGRVNLNYKPADKTSVAVWDLEYDAKDAAKASKENEAIKGFTQRPVGINSLFSPRRSVT